MSLDYVAQIATDKEIYRHVGNAAMTYCISNLHVRTYTRAHVQVQPSILDLGSGWIDCAELWCVVRGQLAIRFTQVRGGVRAHVPTTFPYLWKGRTNCTEIWYAF